MTRVQFGNSENQSEILLSYVTGTHSVMFFSTFVCHFPSVKVLNWCIMWSHHAQFTMSTSYSPPKWAIPRKSRTRFFLTSQVSYGADLLNRFEGAQQCRCRNNIFWLELIMRLQPSTVKENLVLGIKPRSGNKTSFLKWNWYARFIWLLTVVTTPKTTSKKKTTPVLGIVPIWHISPNR